MDYVAGSAAVAEAIGAGYIHNLKIIFYLTIRLSGLII